MRTELLVVPLAALSFPDGSDRLVDTAYDTLRSYTAGRPGSATRRHTPATVRRSLA
jgi:hypothetical protein